mgnify:CR=1 FL=1
MLIILLIGSLTVLLPDQEILNEKMIRENAVNLPYGVLPLFKEKDGVSVGLYSIADTVRWTQLSTTVKYQKGGMGFIAAPILRYGEAHLYPTRKKFNLHADIIRGSIFYRNDNLIFSAGKDIFKIGGAFEYNPTLSPNLPLNYARFIYSGDKFSFSHLISRLDDYKGVEFEWADTSTGTINNLHRYLGIHRLEFKPANWLGISFTEAMLIGGETLGFPFELLSPITIYYLEQYNQKENVNILWNMDVTAIWKNFLFYTDFFIDDFQYEPDPRKEPNLIGLLASVEGIDLKKKGTEFILSYNFMSRWPYCNIRVWQRYQDRDFPIGSQLGNDYDRLLIKALYPISSFKTGFEISFTRRGENSIDTPWPVNPKIAATPHNQFKGSNFLSGMVEKRLSISSITRYKNLITVTMGFYWLQNYKHREGDTKIAPLLHIKINYFL